MKIKKLIFQRNGVLSEPFYHCLAEMPQEGTTDMLITFTTDEDGKLVNIKTCRAIDLNNIEACWRGDVVAAKLQHYFDEQIKANGGNIYDCSTKQLYTV